MPSAARPRRYPGGMTRKFTFGVLGTVGLVAAIGSYAYIALPVAIGLDLHIQSDELPGRTATLNGQRVDDSLGEGVEYFLGEQRIGVDRVDLDLELLRSHGTMLPWDDRLRTGQFVIERALERLGLSHEPLREDDRMDSLKTRAVDLIRPDWLWPFEKAAGYAGFVQFERHDADGGIDPMTLIVTREPWADSAYLSVLRHRIGKGSVRCSGHSGTWSEQKTHRSLHVDFRLKLSPRLTLGNVAPKEHSWWISRFE